MEWITETEEKEDWCSAASSRKTYSSSWACVDVSPFSGGARGIAEEEKEDLSSIASSAAPSPARAVFPSPWACVDVSSILHLLDDERKRDYEHDGSRLRNQYSWDEYPAEEYKAPLRQCNAFDEDDADYVTARSTDYAVNYDGGHSGKSIVVVKNRRSHPSIAMANWSPLMSRVNKMMAEASVAPPLFNSYEEETKGETKEEEEEEDFPAFDYSALSEPLMGKLRQFFPVSLQGGTPSLRYSLARDGPSLDALLDSNGGGGGNACALLAIETVAGEVFGAFVTQPLRAMTEQWYGGAESFLWTTTATNADADDESVGGDGCETKNKNVLEVFPYSFADPYVQVSDSYGLSIGAGAWVGGRRDGFGLALERDLSRGSSRASTTFGSPSLSKLHPDGSAFEIYNIEVWTLTQYHHREDHEEQSPWNFDLDGEF